MNEQNERFDDREIKMLYRDNAQRTAPDMEKLWSRIESEIDKTDAVPQRRIVQTKKTTNSRRTIRALISCAAAFIVIAGIGVYAARKNAGPDKAAEKSGKSESAPNSVSTTVSETAGRYEIADTENIGGSGDNGAVNNAAYGGDGAGKSKGKQNTAEETNDPAVNNTDRTSEEAAASDNAKTAEEQEYKSPADNQNQTAGASASAETAALTGASMFLDVTAGTEAAAPDGNFITTVRALASYGRNGSTKEGEIQLISRKALGLKEGSEYMIPVYEDDSGIHAAYTHAPQIQLTDDGKAIFPKMWSSLSQGAEEYGSGLMITSAENVMKMIEAWRGE